MTEMNADERMGRLEAGLEALNQKVEGLNQRMENFRGEVISRFDGMDAKIDNLGHGINSRIDNLGHGINSRIDNFGHGINSRIDKLTYITIATCIVMLCTLGAVIAGIFLAS